MIMNKKETENRLLKSFKHDQGKQCRTWLRESI